MLPEYMLSDLPAGRSADVAQMDAPGPMGRRLLELNTSGGMRRRLMDLGFSAGEHVECVLKSPPGDPRAYLVRGAVIALRREDAARVRLLEDSIWE